MMRFIFQEAFEELIKMYSLLREEDVLEKLLQNTVKCDDTKRAFSLEQQGCFKKASLMYINILDHRQNDSKANITNFYNEDIEFNNIHLTKYI